MSDTRDYSCLIYGGHCHLGVCEDDIDGTCYFAKVIHEKERELSAAQAENAKLREERDTLKELHFAMASECESRRNAYITLTAAVTELLDAASDACGAVGVRYWNAVSAVREAMGGGK